MGQDVNISVSRTGVDTANISSIQGADVRDHSDAIVEVNALTTCHDVKNERELARAVAAGGQLCDRYISTEGADGYMQLLRSLGDCAFHRGDVVLAAPDTVQREILSTDAFILMASDGLWNTFSGAEACAFVYSSLVAKGYCCGDLHSHDHILTTITELQRLVSLRLRFFKCLCWAPRISARSVPG